MLYEIETIEKKSEEELGEKKISYRLWIRQSRGGNVICFFDTDTKPLVDGDTLLLRGAEKLKDWEIIYFSLHYGDIVEDRK